LAESPPPADPTEEQAVANPGAGGADRERARDRLIEIGDDFEDGNLDKALRKFERARELGLDAMDSELAELGRKLEDATKRLARARARENDGSCEQAIGLYRSLRKDYPQLTEAAQGIKRCQNMLPPDISE
ncbi:serine/threonine protein kinase, partial [Pyxidicoccus sp. 3LFB2]